MTLRHTAALGAFALAFSASSALAQPAAPQHFCGGFGGSGTPVIQPVIYPQLQFDRSNPGFDCQAWQVFIYLNWPAATGQRGAPNPQARFGTPGTTVWETYRTLEQTFLPNAADPGPWNQAATLTAAVPQGLTATAGAGQLRVLGRTSKISRIAIANVARAGVSPAILKSIAQAGGGILWDQQLVPVYYEIAMNADLYNYIQQNGLYNADTQLTFATKTTIALPGGATQYGPTGAIEMKAAWKVLTPAEISSGRFHTAQAVIVGTSAVAPTPVTVGLVGMHIFQMLGASNQGIWATFAQIDNAPVQGTPGGGPYTFNNPNCQPAQCPPNQESETPVATQVVQVFPDDAAAVNVNANMQAMIKSYNATAPWQYYKLVNVQWPLNPVALSSLPVPAMINLPMGNPNTATLMNAVLETFLQQSGTSCLICHQSATISPNQSVPANSAPQNASSYSFMFGYAQSPK